MKITFLIYSTDELGMISELFSLRSFIKILFSHLTISISRFRITIYFPEISAKFPVNFFENFPENSHIPTYITYTHPIPLTHTQYLKLWTHSELQIHFSQKHIFSAFWRLFPTPFMCCVMDSSVFWNTGKIFWLKT